MEFGTEIEPQNSDFTLFCGMACSPHLYFGIIFSISSLIEDYIIYYSYNAGHFCLICGVIFVFIVDLSLG